MNIRNYVHFSKKIWLIHGSTKPMQIDEMRIVNK
jgi:hypothetical protein